MKTLEEIFTIENLMQAHHYCRTCKQHKREVIAFELNIYENLMKLQKSIFDRTYKINHYRVFKVYEPKTRVIESLHYRHRIIQRCLCDNLLRPTLEPILIYDNGACRINKGTDFSRNRLKKFMRAHYSKHGEKGYVLKCDIAKFFPSINHEKLKNILSKIFPEDIMWLLSVFIDSNGLEKGLPIGNQTSQWFALMMLNAEDHFIKETLRVKYYIRYMDDLVIIHHSKTFLQNALKTLTEKVNALGLQFNAKTKISRFSEGISFLGFHFKCVGGKIVQTLGSGAKKRIKRGASRMYQKYIYNIYSATETLNNLYGYKTYLSRCSNKGFFEKLHL